MRPFHNCVPRHWRNFTISSGNAMTTKTFELRELEIVDEKHDFIMSSRRMILYWQQNVSCQIMLNATKKTSDFPFLVQNNMDSGSPVPTRCKKSFTLLPYTVSNIEILEVSSIIHSEEVIQYWCKLPNHFLLLVTKVNVAFKSVLVECP